MVNRVFCYSKEEAKKNKCHINSGRFILEMFIAIVVFSISAALLSEYNSTLMMIELVLLIILIVYLIVKNMIIFQSKSMAFAIDDMGRIFKIAKSDVYHRNDNVFDLFAWDCISEYFREPETMAKIVEEPSKRDDIIAFRILNLYDYSEHKYYFKFKYDFRNLYNGNLVCNRELIIYKSYICYDELVKILLNSPLYKKK